MKKSAVWKILIALGFPVGLWLILRSLGINLNELSPQRVQNFVRSFGVWAPLVYLGIYAQPIIPIPAGMVTIAGGLAFGPFWGTLIVLIGATTRAVLEFLIARFLGQRAVSKLLKGKTANLNQKLGENDFQAVLLIRLIPNLPFDVQNYGLGLTCVKFTPYFIATALGMIPGTFAFVFLGYSLTDPKQIWKLGLIVLVIIGIIFGQRAWQKRHPKNSGGLQ